ncbi:MAG: hypothetical protein SV760_07160 [Halobacteria archaeon]|nr:hypothetical protein [Halobacteria archaeon]
MPEVDVPERIHDSVKDYAQRRGMSVTEAYVELVEYALNNIEDDDEDGDDDLRSGIA